MLLANEPTPYRKRTQWVLYSSLPSPGIVSPWLTFTDLRRYITQPHLASFFLSLSSSRIRCVCHIFIIALGLMRFRGVLLRFRRTFLWPERAGFRRAKFFVPFRGRVITRPWWSAKKYSAKDSVGKRSSLSVFGEWLFRRTHGNETFVIKQLALPIWYSFLPGVSYQQE